MLIKYPRSDNSKRIKHVMLSLVGVLAVFAGLHFYIFYSNAATLALVSDTISTSGLAASADQTIKFTVTNSVPASGTVKVIFEPEKFEIPAGLDYRDLDLLVDGVAKSLGSAAGSGIIGVSVVSGASGSITFTLGSAAIAAGRVVTIKAGRNASFEYSGLYRVKNPSAAGSYLITIKTYDASASLLDQASTRIMILESVRATAVRPSPPAPAAPSSPGSAGGGGGGAGYLPSSTGEISKKREEVLCSRYDLNCDGRINLVDFSILAYWWKRPLTAEAKRRIDFNGDGKVSLVDFSILAYHWTG